MADTVQSKKNPQESTPLLGKSNGNAYETASRSASILEKVLQRFQIHTIQHPQGLLAKTLQVPVSLFEGQAANLPHYLSWKRAAFGENFVAAGQVVLGEWNEVERALTSPQARTTQLGTTPLNQGRLPDANGESSFLLALSQSGAGGNGLHEKYSSAFFKYHMVDIEKRQNDPVAKNIMNNLVRDYKNMPNGRDEDFFTSKEGGLKPFLIKYLHYCMFNIDPDDKEAFEALYSLYYDIPFPLYYYDFFGFLFNLKMKFSIKSRIRKVVKIYEESSMLANFDSENVGISKHEFAELLIPLMGIAATQGPKHLIEVAMGQKPIPEYKEGIDTTSINQIDVWDQLDLNDEKEVHAYLLECGRLNQPVGHSHRVAEEDFTVNIMGVERTFRKGTVISIPINMSCVNKNLYGENVFKFDHKRMNLFDYSTIFHSVGMRHAGRRCPGARFALDMLTEIVVKCGEVRRNME